MKAPILPFIVFSGLPASGKTSLGKQIALLLDLPLLDKDEILEKLFDAEPFVDLAIRQRLSRESDAVLAAAAAKAPGAVLVSFWRHELDTSQSGTPTDWLRALPRKVLEVHCVCDPEVAERRFRERRRHPGHNDSERLSGLQTQFQLLATRGPLALGPTVTVRTDQPVDMASVVEWVRQQLD